MNNHINCQVKNLIKMAFWNTGTASVDASVFEEMKRHAIAAIPASVLVRLDMSSELLGKWNSTVLQQVAYYCHNKYQQDTLPISVPYVILKGTTAAQYYPHPEYRSMGDIDIMTKHEDFDLAYSQLIENGYQLEKNNEREKGIVKNGVMVELHHYFASLNDPKQAAYLDELIIENINDTHILPDMINGLVLLEHVSQHLENGLGLRQILDWMMFVDKCLPDEKWPEFQEMVQKIGLKQLAIVVTQMCILYMGLPARKWCAEAEPDLCEQLMEYVLASGNFGNKQTDVGAITENVFARSRTPRSAFALFQDRGLVNWKATRQYKIFRSFAWLYQMGRYVVMGVRSKQSPGQIIGEYRDARRRNAMFDALGVKQVAKGLVVYRNGEYVKQ